MVKKLCFSILAIFGISLICWGIYAMIGADENDDIIVKATIFPTGTSEESYYFVLKNDATLYSYVGTRRRNDVQKPNFLKEIKDQQQQKLADKDFQLLNSLGDNLGDEINNAIEVYDGWRVSILYNNKSYEFDYGHSQSSSGQIFIEQIIKLSPLTIDIHSWA